MVNLREAAAELWRTLKHEPPRPLLHAVYDKIRVERDGRADIEAILGRSRTKYYVARTQGDETVEFVTDPQTGLVIAKKYLMVTLDDRGAATRCEMRFTGTLRVVREILATRTGPRKIYAGPRYKQPANPRTLLEWFTGPNTEKLLGRGAPGDTYYVNGRPIRPRAYRTLLTSDAGDDLIVEIRSNR